MIATGDAEVPGVVAGGREMLPRSDIGNWWAEVDQVLRGLTLQATVHHDA